jgi:hypothetical protein
MKKEIVKKKLAFKKTLIANMDNSAANQILGGGGTTYSDTPCICSHTCHTLCGTCGGSGGSSLAPDDLISL